MNKSSLESPITAGSYAFEKYCGIALIAFTILLLLTMIMHPAGGSIEHLIRITNTIMITHAIAIVSLPVGCIGFWGLTRKIGANHFLSMMGFVLMSFALVAVLLAATTNGLVLPLFLQRYETSGPDTIVTTKLILSYSFSVNKAFDYIYTGLFCLAILTWSIAILQTRKLPRWIGWTGVAIVAMMVIMILSGVAVNTVYGLRMFFSGIVTWIVATGIVMARHHYETPSTANAHSL